jgi:hypothetical protein
MDENNNETAGSQQATTPAEKAVVFVNSEVLAPPKASPMGGVAKVMIEQSTGMMVQDLQSFLKGFEQVGLIALSRLANNLLTYGTPSEEKPHPTGKASDKDAQSMTAGNGNEMMRDLFKIVSDYAEAKTKISGAIYNANPNPIPIEAPSSPVYTDVSAEAEDPEKKNG